MDVWKEAIVLMLFNEGTWVHEKGYKITVINGEIFIDPKMGLAPRREEIFDNTKWKKVE